MSGDQGQARWQAIWQSRGAQAWALRPISILYGLLFKVRRWLYSIGWLKVERLAVPVVVVGNVVVGGAGKTPTVLALLDHLKHNGWHPGVVSRGYGRQGTEVLEVQLHTPCALCGDEPALIKRNSGLPVFVALQRVDAARALLTAYPEVNIILCDDGLQHLALGRDLAIAVFDDRGVGNGWLVPAGLLREPWPPRTPSVYQPHLVLQHFSHGSAPENLGAIPSFPAQRRLSLEAINASGQRMPLSDLAKLNPTALAGIARPEAFFAMLRAAGVTPAQTVALPDHADIQAYAALLQAHEGVLVCTEKDAVKLFGLEATVDRLWAVPLHLSVDPAFFAAVDAHLIGLSSIK